MRSLLAVALLAALMTPLRADDPTSSLKSGTPDIKAASVLAFGPPGILFIGDAPGGAVFAVETGEKTSPGTMGPIKVEGIDAKIAGLLGTSADQILINDIKVSPYTGTAFVAVARGKGPTAPPAVFTVTPAGKITEVPMTNIRFAKAAIPNLANETRRATEAITDMMYHDGKVYVAALASEQFASQFRVMPFPFGTAGDGTTVEIFHASHGRLETNAPIRTFTVFSENGQAHLLAAYTCTPLVKIPVSDLKPGAKIKGTTLAELGNRNRPLDMIVYEKDGKPFVLMANNARGVMKIDLSQAGTAEGLSQKVSGTAGLPYETINNLKEVVQLTRLDKNHALILQKTASGLNIDTIELP
jgi:hypothetical protein